MSHTSVRMINGRFGDPSLWISLYPKRSILFDCGDCQNLTRKELVSVERLFLTHTHMDHLFGFDRLLRVCIDGRQDLEVYGPPGTRERIEHKLQGITHNLEVKRSLKIKVTELHPTHLLESSYTYQTHFQREQESRQELPYLSEIIPRDTVRLKRNEVLTRVLEFPDYCITYTSLLHVVPVLSYKLTLKRANQFDPEKLNALGLTSGEWISELQKRKNQPQSTLEIEGKLWSVEELQTKLFSERREDVLGYVTDTLWHPKVERRILELMKKVKYFFCDSCYLHQDEDRAKQYYHLTTKQAGELAKKSEVETLVTFHFSLKYGKNFQQLIQETAEIFPAVVPLEGIGDQSFSF